jgi:Uma2 family endonuclease
MARQNPVRHATFEEYLGLEKHSQVCHEFVDGYLFAMISGTADHNRICSRLLRLIYDAAEASGCELFIKDMIVQTPGGKGYYPDLFLTCEESDGRARFKQLPC